ncbi:conserved hypothetical protein [Perkinsus marinus ATCC 50983]|uniref:Uncharacterized protein n=1 Tax=Perkinsus marinus (strain ATCC 50983 / TXsc) TaxID=423536 RepID=C5M002_PERM5|nr:conserved hypothetical protein [Perkinsus marinus ATCC 50983]EEQ97692.1 conserved hypothetical protein [Perkinsus marinus ATCC 50983]|eukprot:XP_002764975.1 conserved hypothetical protein [Perkinsus marinus ATCC 50983]
MLRPSAGIRAVHGPTAALVVLLAVAEEAAGFWSVNLEAVEATTPTVVAVVAVGRTDHVTVGAFVANPAPVVIAVVMVTLEVEVAVVVEIVVAAVEVAVVVVEVAVVVVVEVAVEVAVVVVVAVAGVVEVVAAAVVVVVVVALAAPSAATPLHALLCPLVSAAPVVQIPGRGTLILQPPELPEQ